MTRILNVGDYTVAWIAILPIEVEAALGMLDERHDGQFTSTKGDDYIYIGGEIYGHNVVIARLPEGQNYGVASAAEVANQLKARFPEIRFCLLVGIAAGLPNLSPKAPREARDIRLGDVLVAVPNESFGGIIHYDLGRETSDGFYINSRQAEPPKLVRSAISYIKSVDKRPFRRGSRFAKYLAAFQTAADDEESKWQCPSQQDDRLFAPQTETDGKPQIVERVLRDESERTKVWYGFIGSGNTLMRNAQSRDKLRDQHDLIGLDMEAAGVSNTFPTAVIRGVSDYADGYKNKTWQPYAAAVAAVYAKGILCTIRPEPGRSRKEQNPQEILEAAKQGDLSKIRELIAKQVNVDVIDNNARTPLHLAASGGFIRVVKLLLQKREVDVDRTDINGQTPLHVALIGRRPEIARLLLMSSAETKIRDNTGKTALEYADQTLPLRWMFEHGGALESRNPTNRNTALIQAAIKGDVFAIRFLLDEGANVQAKNKYSSTALAEACMRGHLDVVKTLLAHGADPNARDRLKWTPLSHCIWANQGATLELLLRHASADLETVYPSRPHTILAEAIRLKDWRLARLLIEFGANVHCKDWEGYSPLSRAVQSSEDMATINLLLERGADVIATNPTGSTVLEEAIQSGKLPSMWTLIKNGAPVDFVVRSDYPIFCLLVMHSRGDVELIRLALNRVTNIDAVNHGLWTALREAIYYGFLEISLLLLEKGADVHNLSDEGWATKREQRATYLMFAAWRGQVAIAVALLQHGIDMEAVEANGWTALRIAVEHDQDEVACALLIRGADVYSRAHDGRSPFSRASSSDRLPLFLEQCTMMHDNVDDL